MTGLDLHPEDLLDKYADGALTEAEASRLDAHLSMCTLCRCELQLRSDFIDEQLFAPDAGSREEAPRPLASSMPAKAAKPRVGRARRVAWFAAALLSFLASVSLAARYTGWFGAPGAATGTSLHTGSVDEGPGPRRQVSASGRSHEESPSLVRNPEALAPSSMVPPERVGLASSERRGTPAQSIPAHAASALNAAPAGTLPRHSHASEPRKNSVAASASALLVPGAKNTASASESSVQTGAARAAEPDSLPDNLAALFREANTARRAGNAKRAIELYRKLQRLHSGSPEAELSRATLAALLLERDDAAGALESFDQYLQRGSKLVDAEVLVGRAAALERLGKRTEEIAAWRAVRTRFPGSVYAEQASKRLRALGE